MIKKPTRIQNSKLTKFPNQSLSEMLVHLKSCNHPTPLTIELFNLLPKKIM
jgi:hypothetical protein